MVKTRAVGNHEFGKILMHDTLSYSYPNVSARS